MAPWLTQEDVVGRLEDLADELGSQRAVAARAGVSPPFVTLVFQGRKRPGPRLLALLGLEAVEVYRPRVKTPAP